MKPLKITSIIMVLVIIITLLTGCPSSTDPISDDQTSETIDEIDETDDESLINTGDLQDSFPPTALTKDELYKIFKNSIAAETEQYFTYDDFDADGVREAFAVTGAGPNDYGILDDAKLYFIDSSGKYTVLKKDTYGFPENPVVEVDKQGHKVFAFEQFAGGISTALTFVYGVKDGTAYELDISGKYSNLQNTSGGNYLVTSVSNDLSGSGVYEKNWVSFEYKNGQLVPVNESGQSPSSGQSISIVGSWVVDYDVTAAHNDNMNVQHAFGTSIRYSHGEMSINEDGTAEWYLGFEGGKGTYTFDGKQGTISYHDMNAEENQQVTITKASENGVDYLVLDCPFEEDDYYRIYWIRG